MLLTHYWSIWLLGAVELVLAWRWWRRPPDQRRRCRPGPSWPSPRAACCSCPGCRRSCTRRPTPARPWAGVQRPTNMLGATIQDFGGGDFKDAIAGGRGHAGPGRCSACSAGRPAPHASTSTCAPGAASAPRRAVAGPHPGRSGATASLVTATTYATRYAAVIYPLVALLMAAGLGCFDDPAGPDRGARRVPGPVPARGLLERDLPAHPGSRGGPGHQPRRPARGRGRLLPRPARPGLQPLARHPPGPRPGGVPDASARRAGRLGRLRRAQRGGQPAAFAPASWWPGPATTRSSWSGRAPTAPWKGSARRCSTPWPGPARGRHHRGRGRRHGTSSRARSRSSHRAHDRRRAPGWRTTSGPCSRPG